MPATHRNRAHAALRTRHNWVQLAKFCVVGAIGYAVNLAVYGVLIHEGVHYLLAATCSFLVAVTSNYVWNRLWTFRDRRAGVAAQGMRFFAVALASLAANLVVLHVLVTLGAGKLVGQAIAEGTVDDASGVVTEAWTGPQVAWKMARGYKGAFGGAKINSPWVWGAFCLVFLLGLADFRRLLSLRNLDLLMLLSPTASLWFFNHGNVFTAVPLFYPALVWVVVRGIWVGATGRGSGSRPLWPAWVLLAAAVFLAGFRIGLNVQASNVIDVGYSGVIGAERIVHARAPWGNFPVEDDLKACGPADASGEIRERIQSNGRCESANPQGDTYGPVAYESYI